jgi:hypothetical protein
VLCLLIVGFGLTRVRPNFIQGFFTDGRPGEAPRGWISTGDEAPGLDRVDRVRVLLIDGLGESTAATLPELSALCARGIDARVDNGFPTVSLPVQHVLWTGLTQQQSGVQYRIDPLEEPPAHSLPALVDGAIGIAESHPRIVHSFGFSFAQPPIADELPVDWRSEGFMAEAKRAVSSDSALVFVHVLRVDETGHAKGAESEAYRQASKDADGMLADLVAADPSARWFVLADHGHLPAGGHGGAETDIRNVRACIVGALPEDMQGRSGAMHLVDYARALRESLGVESAESSVGRGLAEAMSEPKPGETLPRPGMLRWSLALACILGSLVLLFVIGRKHRLQAPVWILLAYVGALIFIGPLSLSRPSIYPTLSRDLLLSGTAGYLALVVTCLRAWPQLVRRAWPFALVQWTPAFVLWVAAMILCGGFTGLVGGDPPLVPVWTAHASLLTTTLTASTCVLGLFALAASVRARFGRSRSAEAR